MDQNRSKESKSMLLLLLGVAGFPLDQVRLKSFLPRELEALTAIGPQLPNEEPLLASRAAV